MGGWIWIAGGCLFIVVAGLFFVLGAAVGVSGSFEQFEGIILPLLSTAGSWVAGVGALGAVVVSLWLSERQRREDTENLKVDVKVGFVTGIPGWKITLDIVSIGKRPSTIQSINFCSKNSKFSVLVLDFLHADRDFPATISYGERVSLILHDRTRIQLADYVEKQCQGRWDGLEFRANTNLNTYVARADGNVRDLLQGHLD